MTVILPGLLIFDLALTSASPALPQSSVWRTGDVPAEAVNEDAGAGNAGYVEDLSAALSGHVMQNAPARAALALTTIPTEVEYVRTAGYSVAGDGGEGLYRRAATDPSHTGKVRSSDGAWWELVEDRPRPSQFGAAVDGTSDDATALTNAIAYAEATGSRMVQLDKGITAIGSSIAIPGRFGIEGPWGGRQAGSGRIASTIRWIGGAGPMFTSAESQQSFRDFAVENNGTATSWLELNPGAISNIYERLHFFVPAGSEQFTESVIRSNGNRIGYSRFRFIRGTSPAPVFLDIDGQGTPNGITPIYFSDVLLTASGSPFQVVNILDETLEGLFFVRSHFIQADATNEMTVVGMDESSSINVLAVEGSEFDNGAGGVAEGLFFELQSVDSAIFIGNHVNGGGLQDYFARLRNSHVGVFEGNRIQSFDEYVFDVDATSTVRAGLNGISWPTVRGIYDPAVDTAGIAFPTYGTSTFIRADQMSPTQHGIFIVNVTDAEAYDIRMDMTKPGWAAAGQVFTVVVKNTSGGAVSAPRFAKGFLTAGSHTAPADGFQRSWTFYFDGTNAIEIHRSTADVPNAVFPSGSP